MISGEYRIGRPRQLYTGEAKHDYVAVNKRKYFFFPIYSPFLTSLVLHKR